MSRRRVVVTGLGLIAPTGNTLKQSWENVRDGISGIGVIDSFDTTDSPRPFGGVIKDFDVTDYMSLKDSRKADRFMHYGIAACTEAFEDAGLEVDESRAHRFGVIMGSGIGGLNTIEQNYGRYQTGGARRISPFLRSRQHRQHDFRACFHQVRFDRPESCLGDRLRHVGSLHWPGGTPDRDRRSGRHPGGAARSTQLRRWVSAGSVRRERSRRGMTIRPVPVDPGIWIGTGSYSATGRGAGAGRLRARHPARGANFTLN